MTPIERLRIEVHRACESVYGKGKVPKLAGQVVIAKSYPPCSCPDEDPFYTVSVLGVWRKDRHWMDSTADAVVVRATEAVREMVMEKTA